MFLGHGGTDNIFVVSQPLVHAIYNTWLFMLWAGRSWAGGPDRGPSVQLHGPGRWRQWSQRKGPTGSGCCDRVCQPRCSAQERQIVGEGGWPVQGHRLHFQVEDVQGARPAVPALRAGGCLVSVPHVMLWSCSHREGLGGQDRRQGNRLSRGRKNRASGRVSRCTPSLGEGHTTCLQLWPF